jgi:CRISPR type III-A-associated RAMP protein Csm5
MMNDTLRRRLSVRYRLTVKLLSPLHINSGEGDLRATTGDYVVREGEVWRLDQGRLAEVLDDEQIQELATGASLPTLVAQLTDEQLEQVVSYRRPAPADLADRILPHIKVADGRPYLPGSSLKGFLRTALVWALAAGDKAIQAQVAAGLEMVRHVEKLADALWAQIKAGADLTRREIRVAALRTILEVPSGKEAWYDRVFRDRFELGDRKLGQLGRSWDRRRLRQNLWFQGRAQAMHAADHLTALTLGPNPNEDYLRTLSVGDGHGTLNDLVLCPVEIWATTGSQFTECKDLGRAAVEVLRPGTCLVARARLDRHLVDIPPESVRAKRSQVAAGFRQRHKQVGARAKALHDGSADNPLADWCAVGNAFVLALIEHERSFCERYRCPELADFYQGLAAEANSLTDNECLAQVGWGTGWSAKTIGLLLGDGIPIDPLDVRQCFRLGESRSKRGTYAAEFPKTRRLAWHDGKGYPLGWIKLRWEEV